MQKKYVIIGTSAAGLSAAKKLRQLDSQARVICVSDEQEKPYNKCFLADYLGNVHPEDRVYTVQEDYHQNLGIEFMLGKRVERIVTSEKKLICFGGQEITYDQLLLATGTRPFIPPILGVHDYHGVFTFHTLADTQRILAYVKQHSVQQAVVIGAGLTGLEAAYALQAHKVQVSVVDCAPQVLNRQVDAEASLLIERCMQEHGAVFMSNSQVRQIVGELGRVTAVVLHDGKMLPVQLVIVATGARVDQALFNDAGIALYDGGIVVNEYMQTSQESIFAAGDVVVVKDQLTGQLVHSCTWPDAMLQGSYAAQAMVGQSRAYPGVMVVTSSAFFGIKFVTCGPVVNSPETTRVILRQGVNFYHKYVVEGSYLKGFLLVGEVRNLAALRRAVMTQQPVEEALFE